MSDPHLTHARSFGSVAESYDRGRPTYPREAAAWLAGESPVSVLELGAGTGKLTAELVALGHDVHATDPDRAMLDVLARDLPDVRTSTATAEEIPAGDATYDVVVAAQAFHWFDHDKALPEIARVLRPGGTLALVWNQRDTRIPWVRRLGNVLGDQDTPGQHPDPAAPLVVSPLFGLVEEQDFRSWQTVTRTSVVDLVLSRSNVAVLDEEARAEKVAEVLAFYDDYGRGMDGMQLPYVVRCFRAEVVGRPEEPGRPIDIGRESRDVDPPTDGDGSGMLLIDFR